MTLHHVGKKVPWGLFFLNGSFVKCQMSHVTCQIEAMVLCTDT